VARFRHQAIYNEHAGRIEMHLLSTQRQQVNIADVTFGFERGSGIRTECSYKYSVDGFARVAARAGLSAA
jgi:uncharacterized SAM-dependent methyltransferase